MILRTQISLESKLHSQIRMRAAALGISFAEYIRRLIEHGLKEMHREIDRSVIFDLGISEPSDIAKHKDQMISKAIAAGRPGASLLPLRLCNARGSHA